MLKDAVYKVAKKVPACRRAFVWAVASSAPQWALTHGKQGSNTRAVGAVGVCLREEEILHFYLSGSEMQ